MKLVLFLTCFTFVSGKISTSLTSGSFDDQTYGRNGVVLLWDNTEVYEKFTAAASAVTDEDIDFWDLSCAAAPEFCHLNARGQEVPFVLYSFRNEPWKSLSVKEYTEHAFTTFFNTQIRANCFANRSLCTPIMNETIAEQVPLKFERVKRAYLDTQQEAAQIEHDWEEISGEIQQKFFEQRKEVQEAVSLLDEKIKVLGQMLEHIHNENYKLQ